MGTSKQGCRVCGHLICCDLCHVWAGGYARHQFFARWKKGKKDDGGPDWSLSNDIGHVFGAINREGPNKWLARPWRCPLAGEYRAFASLRTAKLWIEEATHNQRAR